MIDENRRKFARINTQGAATLLIKQRTIAISIEDISLKGALASFDPDTQSIIGESGHLRWDLTPDDASIIIDVKVIWQNENIMGFIFEEMNLESAQQLRRLLELNLGSEALMNRELGLLMKPD